MPSLHWIGKDKVISHYLDVPHRVLDKRYSFGEADAAANNKIIHGDNLEALKWLCMMYPRLSLLKRLLSQTGVLFVSIDSIEMLNLKLILDAAAPMNPFEAQGEDRDNSDSERKLALGKERERLAHGRGREADRETLTIY